MKVDTLQRNGYQLKCLEHICIIPFLIPCESLKPLSRFLQVPWWNMAYGLKINSGSGFMHLGTFLHSAFSYTGCKLSPSLDSLNKSTEKKMWIKVDLTKLKGRGVLLCGNTSISSCVLEFCVWQCPSESLGGISPYLLVPQVVSSISPFIGFSLTP